VRIGGDDPQRARPLIDAGVNHIGCRRDRPRFYFADCGAAALIGVQLPSDFFKRLAIDRKCVIWSPTMVGAQ